MVFLLSTQSTLHIFLEYCFKTHINHVSSCFKASIDSPFPPGQNWNTLTWHIRFSPWHGPQYAPAILKYFPTFDHKYVIPSSWANIRPCNWRSSWEADTEKHWKRVLPTHKQAHAGTMGRLGLQVQALVTPHGTWVSNSYKEIYRGAERTCASSYRLKQVFWKTRIKNK